jgi:phosphoadenosine phosphosulfate reductase
MAVKLKSDELKNLLSEKSIEESLKILVSQFPGKVVFTTSFGMEDQVLTDIIFRNDFDIEVATLDTGRLFPETYKVFNDTIFTYNKKINVFFPDYLSVEKIVTEKGPFSFYDSMDNRLECCKARKVIPLTRALLGKKCWISGIRAEQSENRSQMDWLEYDDDKKLFKFYPLFNWSLVDVNRYIKDNDVPYNSLHDSGFLSLGCEPCTRAVKPGEDLRSGRWWWENDGPKECGCHIK